MSVILPVYNVRPDWLRESLESVLAQTYSDFEMIVLNDGSTDPLVADTVKSYDDARIRYVEKPNTGIADTLNVGLAAARGEFVARMDADDVSLPMRLERQVAYLDTHPDVALVGTWFEQFPESRIVRHPERFSRLDLGAFGNCLAHPTVMFRRQAFADRGLAYDPAWVPVEDFELWGRATMTLGAANVPEVLLRYRMHGGSVSVNRRREQYAKFEAVQERILADYRPARATVRRRDLNVVRLCGGLGNQMFQYAFGRAIGARFDFSWFGGDQERMRTFSRYALDEFGLKVDFITPGELHRELHNNRLLKMLRFRTGLKVTYERDERRFSPEYLSQKRRYYLGYFQCERYFNAVRDELPKLFRLAADPCPAYAKLREEIRSCNAVSVHVRRGDYLKLGDIYANLGVDYYRAAMKLVEERVKSPRFYVFSDDIKWAEENLSGLGFNSRFVREDWGIVSGDMMLMRECRHNVIANSTYSWWGAWLNENPKKIVVAPRHWYADGGEPDLIPEDWKRL